MYTTPKGSTKKYSNFLVISLKLVEFKEKDFEISDLIYAKSRIEFGRKIHTNQMKMLDYVGSPLSRPVNEWDMVAT